MDVIEASHLEVLKSYVAVNQDLTFKMRKFQNTWILGIMNIYDDTDFAIVSDPSFATAIKKMSNLISQQNKEQENGGCRRS